MGNIRVPDVNQDPDDGMAVVQANDIQNGKCKVAVWTLQRITFDADTEYACPVTIGTPGGTSM